MSSIRAPRWSWSALVVLACTPARAPDGAGPSGQVEVEAAPQLSPDDVRPIVYACRRPRAADSGYRFEVDGVPVRPGFVSLTGDDVLREGDIIVLPPASMIVGPPGHYRYFTDPARPRALELEVDGGPRHLVALRVGGRQARLRRIDDPPGTPDVSYGEPETIDRPLAELRQLRGLALETWSDDIAATVARLDGARLIVSYSAAWSFGPDALPELPPALPPALRALKLEVALAKLILPPPQPPAPEPLAFDGLPALSGLRSLELQITSRDAEYLDAAALARFPGLQRFVLDGSLPLHDSQQLRALPDLRVLDLRHHGELRGLAFVGELPALRRLDVAYTGVDSLAPIAGHPRLAVVQADAAPIAALPDPAPPELRELSVMATRLHDDAVESFAAAVPRAVVHHRWNQRLADAAACATRIHVRTGGVCHRRPEHERTLFAADDPAAVRELLPLLRVDEARSDSYCMCCGTLTIELLRDDEAMAEVTVHHGRSLRYDGWPADGQLSDPGPLCAWLASHGAPEACRDD